MSGWRSCVLACVVFTCGVASMFAQDDPAPEPSALEQRKATLVAKLARERFELVRYALDRDLYVEAGALLKQVGDDWTDASVEELAKELRGVDPSGYAQRYRDAVRTKGAEFRRRRAAIERPAAVALVTLGDEAAAAGDEATATSAYSRAYAIDGKNAQALKQLKARDFDLIFNYGAVSRADKDATRAVLKRLGGNFLNENDLERELGFWGDAWGMKTRHYRFVTNAGSATVFKFAQACEDLFEALEAWLKQEGFELRKLREPAQVYLFDSPISYGAILKLVDQDPPKDAIGFYASDSRVGYFYDDPTYYEDLGQLIETFFHEGTHQLLDLRTKVPRKGDSPKFPLTWIEEGLATYMESLAVTEVDGRRVYAFGGEIDDDLADGLEQFETGKLMPLDEFMHLDQATWDGYEHAYSHAVLLMHWLLEGDARAHRKAGIDLLKRYLAEGGCRDKDAFALLKLDAAAVESSMHFHASLIAKTLKRRQYKTR